MKRSTRVNKDKNHNKNKNFRQDFKTREKGFKKMSSNSLYIERCDRMTNGEFEANRQLNLDAELKLITSNDIFLVLTPFDMLETLERIGYSVDKQGFLIDNKTQNKVEAEDKKEINIYDDKHFALVSGSSHIFVRNVAGFSQYLAEHERLKFKEL